MIEKEIHKKTLSSENQEINIYKMSDDEDWQISCTIPKFARRYRKFLKEGREVYNAESGQLIEIHGTLSNKSVSLTKAREMSDEERQKARENFLKIRASFDS